MPRRPARWETDIDREIEPGDSLDRVLDVIASADTRAIQETAARLDLDQVARVADAIAGANWVELFGLGSSGGAAREMAFRLERIRVACWYREDAHKALTNAALLGPGDVAIGLSHSGRTREARSRTLRPPGPSTALSAPSTTSRHPAWPGSPRW